MTLTCLTNLASQYYSSVHCTLCRHLHEHDVSAFHIQYHRQLILLMKGSDQKSPNTTSPIEESSLPPTDVLSHHATLIFSLERSSISMLPPYQRNRQLHRQLQHTLRKRLSSHLITINIINGSNLIHLLYRRMFEDTPLINLSDT
mmetsp:Transcript_4038/g.5887  ORF Transcript_4038/g.5887 Transcript_4038/m.5887 type:complete len:145 (-) Transcript_4038:748-1182(-)